MEKKRWERWASSSPKDRVIRWDQWVSWWAKRVAFRITSWNGPLTSNMNTNHWNQPWDCETFVKSVMFFPRKCKRYTRPGTGLSTTGPRSAYAASPPRPAALGSISMAWHPGERCEPPPTTHSWAVSGHGFQVSFHQGLRRRLVHRMVFVWHAAYYT